MRLLAAILLLAPLARADEESARYFLARGKAALVKDDLEGAASFFERSLEEKEAYAPALVALADLARRQDRRTDALRHLEACLGQRDRSDLSPDERAAMEDARKLRDELDAAGSEFEALVAGYVLELTRLAERSKGSPELARECWRSILLVQPDHAEALRQAAPAPAETPRGTPLFDGKGLDGWSGGPPAWTVEDGILHGRISGAANVNRTERDVAGDFALVCEARVKADDGEDPLFGILFGIRDTHDHLGLWLWTESWRLERTFEKNRRSDLQRRSFKRYPARFSRFDWHAYRIEVAGKRIRCFVDGEELWSFSGPDRDLDGAVGLWVQDMAVEVRKVVLEER